MACRNCVYLDGVERCNLDFSNETEPDLLSPEQIVYHIKACARNNRESQKAIYSTFYSYALAVCERYSNNNEDACDILNHGFLYLFKKINHYKLIHTNISGAFKGWMREVMIESSIDYYKKNYKDQRVLEINETVYPLPDSNDASDEQFNPLKIMGAVRELSPLYRIIYNLHVIEGLSHEVIAEKLNTTKDNSKLNLWRARKQLQNILFARSILSRGIIS